MTGNPHRVAAGGRAASIALAACLTILLSVGGLACGSDSTTSSDGTAGGTGKSDAVLGGVEVTSSDADGGSADAPPFNFAGSSQSTSLEEVFEEPAEEGDGTILFADGRETEISIYTCYDFVPDRVSTGRGEVGLAFFGRGEMADGQRFQIEVEHRDGVNVVTLETTADPDRLMVNTNPVWSSLELDSTANGLSLDLRDFWLLVTVFLKGDSGPEVISTPGRVGAAAAEQADEIDTPAEARELFDEIAAQEADEGYAAKVDRLTVTCLDGG